MKYTNFKKWLFIIIGGFITSIFSFTVLYYLLIPDLCYYHSHEMNYMMSLFFTVYPGSNTYYKIKIIGSIEKNQSRDLVQIHIKLELL